MILGHCHGYGNVVGRDVCGGAGAAVAGIIIFVHVCRLLLAALVFARRKDGDGGLVGGQSLAAFLNADGGYCYCTGLVGVICESVVTDYVRFRLAVYHGVALHGGDARSINQCAVFELRGIAARQLCLRIGDAEGDGELVALDNLGGDARCE